MRRRSLGVIMAAAVASAPRIASAEDGSVRLHAAGSLKPALTDVAGAFTARYGTKVEATFGASGLLRQLLERGEPGGLFASADMGNPLALEQAGKAGPVVAFARNRLCGLARPGLDVTPETLLDRMLDPSVRLGTSTPGADPAGDYAWEAFRKAEAAHPGAGQLLQAKARKLVGAADAPSPPPGISTYAWHIRDGRADLFLTYCTNAQAVSAEVAEAKVIELPPALATGAIYGLTILKGADAANAATLAMFILSAEGQSILARNGFSPPR